MLAFLLGGGMDMLHAKRDIARRGLICKKDIDVLGLFEVKVPARFRLPSRPLIESSLQGIYYKGISDISELDNTDALRTRITLGEYYDAGGRRVGAEIYVSVFYPGKEPASEEFMDRGPLSDLLYPCWHVGRKDSNNGTTSWEEIKFQITAPDEPEKTTKSPLNEEGDILSPNSQQKISESVEGKDENDDHKPSDLASEAILWREGDAVAIYDIEKGIRVELLVWDGLYTKEQMKSIAECVLDSVRIDSKKFLELSKEVEKRSSKKRISYIK